MTDIKKFSSQALVRVMSFMAIAWLAVAGGVYWLLRTLSRQQAAAPAQAGDVQAASLADWVAAAQQIFWPWFAPAVLLVFLLLGLLLWASLRSAIRKQAPAAGGKPAAATRPRKLEEAREAIELNKRLFLHLISMLQKEGRLVDFFAENLVQYQDAQIGAAVRSIHESCKKTLDKYLAPQAVLEQNEGDEIAVGDDFDPNSLKLIGNVTGQPPFKGIVRHRGWRARKIDLPTLSGKQDPGIIAPAEVEII